MKNLMRITEVLLFVILLFSCSTRDDFMVDEEMDGMMKSAKVEQVTGDRYIVMFKDEVSDPGGMEATLRGKHGFGRGHVYNKAFKGFSARLSTKALEALKKDSRIALIEPDLIMTTCAQTVPTGIMRFAANTNTVVPIDGDSDSPDVDIAVVDTGVDKEHADLTVSGGVRYYNAGSTDASFDDNNGHGSHVAGIIAAKDNDAGVVGVCPGARIWAVKVLDSSGSGYTSDIVAGLNWVLARSADIEVVNMSLGGTGRSSSYRTAIQNCVNAGIVVVVAAGNSKVDVYGKDGKFGTYDDYIPASYPEAMTISAMADSDGLPGGLGTTTSYGPDDSWATFSNYSKSVTSTNPVTSAGKAIDLILPGVNIYSCYKDANYATMSGTSMACPHGAGLAALYIVQNGRANDAAGVATIRQALIDGGKLQSDPTYGLKTQNDPDGYKENLGWAALTGEAVDYFPVANAGDNQTVSLSEGATVAEITLDGSGSTDDKGIESWVWKEGETELGSGAILKLNFAPGIHSVVLTVTDAKGQSDTDEVTITVNAYTPNVAPTADFSFTTNNLTATFTDKSNDSDGTIAEWLWDFGDGTTSTSKNPVKTYSTAGTYHVGLTVTDDDGATGSTSKSITVATTPQPSDIVLTYTTAKYRNQLRITLKWTGGTPNYTVKRNGSTIATVSTTSYLNTLTRKGTYTYEVCDINGCSNTVSVTY